MLRPVLLLWLGTETGGLVNIRFINPSIDSLILHSLIPQYLVSSCPVPGPVL